LLFVQIPLNLPNRELKQRFDSLLVKYHEGKRGMRYARASHAKYPVIGQPNINALKTTLMVYDYHKDHPDLKLWEVALILDQFKSVRIERRPAKKLEGFAEKNLMAATVSRYLRKAKAMIENVGAGRFPDTSQIASSKVT
jgi:hypothetical protein